MGETILKKYLGFCSYVGLRYRGYQEQKWLPDTPKTVQQVLEIALSKITKTTTKISSCSRTDAGVNAYSLPFHFTISIQPHRPIASIELLKKALNYHLRFEDIKIIDLKGVSLDFDVRKQCLEKEYVYKIEAGLGDALWNPIQQHKLVYSINSRLDTLEMKKGLQEFLGLHNFYNFTIRNQTIKHETFRFMRNINEIYLVEEKSEKEEEKNIQKIILGFKAKGFLTYQIRYMVNALKDVGEGNYSIENIRNALNVEENHEPEIGRRTAPAKGLFLKNVIFKET